MSTCYVGPSDRCNKLYCGWMDFGTVDYHVRSEAFTAAKVNEIFWGYQPCQLVKKWPSFQGPFLFPSSGSDVMRWGQSWSLKRRPFLTDTPDNPRWFPSWTTTLYETHFICPFNWIWAHLRFSKQLSVLHPWLPAVFSPFIYLFVCLFIPLLFWYEMWESACVPFQGVLTHTEIVSCVATVPTLNNAQQINCHDQVAFTSSVRLTAVIGNETRIRRPDVGRFALSSVFSCDLYNLSFWTAPLWSNRFGWNLVLLAVTKLYWLGVHYEVPLHQCLVTSGRGYFRNPDFG
jgi:hypothetical protein